MSRSPEARRGAGLSWRREVASATAALALLGLSTSLSAAQVLRDPPTPYHFLRYDDVPSDENSPYWADDFWSPLKFIPLDIAPGSYVNFGGRELPMTYNLARLPQFVDSKSHPGIQLADVVSGAAAFGVRYPDSDGRELLTARTSEQKF